MMSLRRFLALLFALTVIAAPLGLPAMAHAVAAPSHQMAREGHCGEQPAPADHGKVADKSCCAAMCMAVAIEPAAAIKPLKFARAIERPAGALQPHSYLAELPTPPPRLS